MARDMSHALFCTATSQISWIALAMSSERLSAAHAADMEIIVRRGMTKGYEILSLLTPPVYAAFVFMRKGKGHFTVNRFLRATWVGGAVGTQAQ